MSSAASLNASFEASGKNWDNREFISTIQFSILKMVEFLNRFGSSGICSFHSPLSRLI